ncbi:MAG: nonstructural protein [Microvirus sp.]|nr:MAG: nonstructural protein [Microvirus sp.]
MRVKLYSLFDASVGIYSQPFAAQTVGQAYRMIHELALSGDHAIGRYANEFSLYDLGWFDQVEGILETHIPVLVARAKDVLQTFEVQK